MRWLERFGLPARARVGVLGLGQEGMATLRFLLDEGCGRVHVFDAALPGTQEAVVRQMIAEGVEHFVEFGQGRVLGGMLRRIDRGRRVSSVGSPADAKAFWE